MSEFNLSEMRKKFIERSFKEIENNNSIERNDKDVIKSWVEHTFEGLNYFVEEFIKKYERELPWRKTAIAQACLRKLKELAGEDLK